MNLDSLSKSKIQQKDTKQHQVRHMNLHNLSKSKIQQIDTKHQVRRMNLASLSRCFPCRQALKFSTSWQYFLQYLSKDVRDRVDFLPADKHQSFLQVDTIIFDAYGQAYPNFPK